MSHPEAPLSGGLTITFCRDVWRETRAIEANPQDADARATAHCNNGDYATAWRDPHKVQELGKAYSEDFLKALSEKMPEPHHHPR